MPRLPNIQSDGSDETSENSGFDPYNDFQSGSGGWYPGFTDDDDFGSVSGSGTIGLFADCWWCHYVQSLAIDVNQSITKSISNQPIDWSMSKSVTGVNNQLTNQPTSLLLLVGLEASQFRTLEVFRMWTVGGQVLEIYGLYWNRLERVRLWRKKPKMPYKAHRHADTSASVLVCSSWFRADY